jgi:hypothetical protein
MATVPTRTARVQMGNAGNARRRTS